MAEELGQGQSIWHDKTGRVVWSIAAVAVVLSVAFNIVDWAEHGQLNWRGLVTSVGIGTLLLAYLVGPQRRVFFYALLVASLALVPVSFLL
jgi:hypothetical protein